MVILGGCSGLIHESFLLWVGFVTLQIGTTREELRYAPGTAGLRAWAALRSNRAGPRPTRGESAVTSPSGDQCHRSCRLLIGRRSSERPIGQSVVPADILVMPTTSGELTPEQRHREDELVRRHLPARRLRRRRVRQRTSRGTCPACRPRVGRHGGSGPGRPQFRSRAGASPLIAMPPTRIRGALLDELRRRDWASRSVRARARKVNAAADELTARLGRAPDPPSRSPRPRSSRPRSSSRSMTTSTGRRC